MEPRRVDVFYVAAVFIFVIVCFLVKKPNYCTDDAISITLLISCDNSEETFKYSSLYVGKRVKSVVNFRRKSLICILLLVCGDIESCPGPGLFKNTSDFTILHQNIRGLTGKKDLLEDFILQKNIKIFAVTETLLQDTIPTSLVNIRGYVFERNDRNNNKGGGTGLYIKQDIEYTRRNDLVDVNTEAIWIEIKQNNSKSFILGVVYRPPDNSKYLSKNFENSLLNTIIKVNAENKELIIIGDLNINYLNKDLHRQLKDNIALQGMKQIIKEPTRSTKDSQSLIDVILTNRPNNLCLANVILSSLSDHDIISCKRKVNNIKMSDITINCRDYKNYDPTKINAELSSTDWKTVYQTADVNIAWRALKEILTRVINEYAPIITKRVKGKRSPWLNRELKKEMNFCDSLRRKFQRTRTDSDHNAYKKQRNKTNILVRKARSEHHKKLLKDSASNPQKFWRTIKDIFPSKEKVICAKSFLIEGVSYSEPSVIASKFCSFFSEIAGKLKSTSIVLKDFIWSPPFKNCNKTYTTFKFRPVTVNETYKHLKRLKRNKSYGIDNLSPGFLKDTAINIAKPLNYVINLCLSHGEIPEDFKIGKVTPIFKGGSKHHLSNYRPITVLPICSKILEHCIHYQLMDHLETHKLLSKDQFGFRRNRNTEIAATIFVDSIRRNMDAGKLTGAIFIDLSKAFDTLSHSQIIANLANYGIHDVEKEFFTNYLFNRKQQVNFQNSMSDIEAVTCGVPQGSILGPLLFLLNFDDVGSVLQDCDIIMYADDTVIFASAKENEEIQQKLSNDFQRVADWLEANELITNMKPGKTECMIFGTPQRTKNKELVITYRQNIISNTSTYKYLGVNLDKSLSMSEHTNTTYKKALGRLYLLQRLRSQLTVKAATVIYQSLLVPLFTYCSIITCQMNRTYKQKVKLLEDRARKIIFKGQPAVHYIPSVDHMMKKRLCQNVYKCLNGDVCEHFDNYFEVMTNNTRNKNTLLRLPKIRLESSKKSFFYCGAKCFNELPPEIRAAQNIKEFLKYF